MMLNKMMLLLLVVFMSFSIVNAQEIVDGNEVDPNLPVVLEDFEGDLSAWAIEESGLEYVMIDVDPLDPNNQALMFVPQDGTHSMTLPFVVDANDTSTTLAFRALYQGLGDPVINDTVIGVADETSNDVDAANWGDFYAILRMGGDTRIDYRDGGSYKTAVDVNDTEELKWYNFILDLDSSSMTYDIYIDNALVVQDAGFRSSDPNGIQNILLRWTNKQTSLVYIDDFMTNVPIPKVEDDFEGDLSAWEIGEIAAGYATIEEDPTDPNNKVLQLVAADGTHNAILPWILDPNATSTLTFRMMFLGLTGDITTTNNNVTIGAADKDSGSWGDMYSIVRMGPGTQIDYRNGGSYATAMVTSEELIWYNVKMDMDSASGTYDLYINDELIIEGAGFRSNDPDGIASVMIRWKDDATSVMYVDDVLGYQR